MAVKKRKEISFSNDIMSDIYNNSPHVKLSVEEEIKIIKRAKLSFYDDTTEKERKISTLFKMWIDE